MTPSRPPADEDFLRILKQISDDAVAIANKKSLEIRALFGRAGGIGNSRLPITLAAEILPIHKECVNRAMNFVALFERKSDLTLDELSGMARDLLIDRVVIFASPVIKAMQFPRGVSSYQGFNESTIETLKKQIDEGIRNLKAGFVDDRSLAMNPADTIQAKALKILEVIYERTRASENPVFVEQLGGQLGIYIDDVRAAWRYLKDKDLIETFSIPYTARVSAWGVDAIEAAQLHPDKTTSVFPSTTYNITVNGSGSGSQINVATEGSTQISQTISNDPTDVQQLVQGTRKLVEQLRQALPTSSVPKDMRQQIDLAIGELWQAADEEKPEPARLRRGLASLGRISSRQREICWRQGSGS